MTTDKDAAVFAQGLIQLLTPVITECDNRVQDVFTSQAELSSQIDVLSEGLRIQGYLTHQELAKFMDVSKTPHLTPYVQKLNNARSRMTNINNTLTQINARLENIQKQATM